MCSKRRAQDDTPGDPELNRANKVEVGWNPGKNVWRGRGRARKALLGRNISRRRERSTMLKAKAILKMWAGMYCPRNLGVTRGLLGAVSVADPGWNGLGSE